MQQAFSLLNVKSSVEKKPKRYPVEHVEFISDVKPPAGLIKRFRESMFGKKNPDKYEHAKADF